MVNESNIPEHELPSPRRLLLNLLGVAESGVLTATQAVRAGEVFDISATTIRVTLTRLAQSALVEQCERGVYRLGPAARRLGGIVATWREVESIVAPWTGHWNACFLSLTDRRYRPLARATDRALAIGGFRPLAPGLFVRPDNLQGRAGALRCRLSELGMDPEAIITTLADLDLGIHERAMALWDSAGLSDSYRRQAKVLRNWLDTSSAEANDLAARESFLLGDATIRQIIFDPLLPAPLVDVTARQELISTMIAFDIQGRTLWHSLLGISPR